MLAGRNWLRKAALLLAVCAGGVGASAPPPAAAPWVADPDDQFLLDVTIRQLRLGDGVRAYNTPEGTCVVLGDFLTTLDVPVRVDLGSRKASGWAFKESNRIAIDYGAASVGYGTKTEAIAPGTIRETPEGWCVQATALSRWFGIGVRPMTAGSVLLLQSEAKLPVELAMERQMRARQIKPAKFDLASLPQVRVPYRMWRSPALDFVVSAGVTYRAKDGMQVDRQSSIYAAGEIAHLSYDAQLSTDRKGMPSAVRLRAFRSDPDGHLLGPAHATHFAVGDVEGFDSKLTGSSAFGRGAVITNRPLNAQTAFDRSRFEGDLPPGWEAEIYRNEELLGFARSTSDNRYAFDDVQLLYGENRVRVVLYGPQGQIRTREELINVGQDNVPPGKTWYWAGFNQPGRDIFTLHDKPPDGGDLPKAQATVSLEHGIDDRTSVAVLARAMLIDDQRVTFVEGTVRRSIGLAMIELGGARETSGGTAARAQILGKIGPVNVNAEALIANDFHLRGRTAETLRNYQLALDVPLKLGTTTLPVHADARLADRGGGSTQLDAAARLSANFERFNLSSGVTYRKQYRAGSRTGGEFGLQFIGSGRVGDVRLRGTTEFDVSPQARLRSAELSAYWSAGETTDWEGDLVYDVASHRGRARDFPHSPPRQSRHRPDRRGRDRRIARARRQSQFLARSGARLFDVAAATGAGGRGPRHRLSRPQRQWGARFGRTARTRRADHHRHPPGRPADQRQGLGHGRRPWRLHAGRDRGRRNQPGRSDAGAEEGAASRGPASGRRRRRRDRARRRRRHRRRHRQKRRAGVRGARPRTGRCGRQGRGDRAHRL